MNLTENGRRSGSLSAYLIDPNWKGPFPYDWDREKWPLIKQVFHKTNTITKLGQLYSYSKGFQFAYIAGGTGTNTPTVSDKVLQLEVQRFEVADVVYTPGQIQAFAEVPSDQGNITWKEWGVLMDDATAQIGTGTLYSHLLQTYAKQLGDTILLTYTLRETTS